MSFSTLWGSGRALALGAVLTALPVLGQDSGQYSQQGGQQYGQQSSQYNRGTETTLDGTIAAVNTNTPTGEHVILDTAQGQFDVQLGPQQYLQQQQMSLQPGQRIQVTGAQSTISGQQALIARQVTGAGNTVTLRTSSGIPLWSQQFQGAGAYGQAAQMGAYQQGPYQQPPIQQTPYMGQPGPFSQNQAVQMGIANWQQGSIYNPFTETTVTGTVQEVKQCACGPFSSTYVTMNTNQGRMTVQLAPSQYLSQHQLQISRGQQIQVTGSKLNVNGNPVVLARVVSTPQRTVALRNQQGMPQWTQTSQLGAQQPQPGFADGMAPSTDEDEDLNAD